MSEPLTDAELLLLWAVNSDAAEGRLPHPECRPHALAMRKLFAEIGRLKGHNLALAERLAAASECLTRAAERRDAEPVRKALRGMLAAWDAVKVRYFDAYYTQAVRTADDAAAEARWVLGGEV